MKKIFFLFLLLIAHGNIKASAQSEVTKEEYSIYAKVFEQIFGRQFKPESKPVFAIFEDTVNLKTFPKYTYSPLENILKDKSQADYFYKINPQKGMTPAKLKELSSDFEKKNQSASKLKRRFPLKHEYVIVSRRELDELLGEGKKIYDRLPNKIDYELISGGIIWKPFNEKYSASNGCYNFSRASFSADKNFALVFLHRERGDYGEYTYYIFEKVGGEWKNPKMFGWGRHD